METWPEPCSSLISRPGSHNDKLSMISWQPQYLFPKSCSAHINIASKSCFLIALYHHWLHILAFPFQNKNLYHCAAEGGNFWWNSLEEVYFSNKFPVMQFGLTAMQSNEIPNKRKDKKLKLKRSLHWQIFAKVRIFL